MPHGPKIRAVHITKALLLEAIDSSPTANAAWLKLGINGSTFYRLRKRFGIPPTAAWASHGLEALVRLRPPIPPQVIKTSRGRLYVGTLVGTEGCITCSYDRGTDTTDLVVVVEMTDREWIAKFAELVGLSPPSERGRDVGPNHLPVFRRALSGLRALRVLNEILAHLYGQRLKEAKRAIGYFSPSGHVHGKVLARQIWGDLRN